MTDVSQSWNRTRCLSLLCISARQVWLCPSCTGSSSSASSARGSAAIVLSVLHHSAGLANRDLDVVLACSWGSEIPSGHRPAQRLGHEASSMCPVPPSISEMTSMQQVAVWWRSKHCRRAKFRSPCFVKKSRTEVLFNRETVVINRSRIMRIRRNLKISGRNCFSKDWAAQFTGSACSQKETLTS